VLYRRIDRRARWLFEVGGLVAEVSALREQGYGPELRPMTGHGYAEAGKVLDGRWGTEEAIEMTARRTRQYAKRQLSWFGRDRRIVWLPAGEREADDPSLVAHAKRLLRAALS
jgi:tRNA dimethylallyltransferase